MTLQSSVSRVIYRGDGNQKEFPIPFRFLKTGHIAVFSPEGIVSGTDYEVSGNIQGNGFSGGTVIFRNAPSGAVAILRMVPFVQESDYVPNGDVPAETLEGNLDYLTMQTQELLEAVGRCVKMPETSNQTPEEWLAAWEKMILGAKDMALDSASTAASAAAACSSAQLTIATIWAEITGDSASAEEAIKALQEAWEAAGSVKAAAEAGKASVNEASMAAVEYAKGQIQESQEASLGVLSATTKSRKEELLALIAETVGAEGTVAAAVAAAEAAKEAAEAETGKISGISEAAQASISAAVATAEQKRQQAQQAATEAAAQAEQAGDSAAEAYSYIASTLANKNAAEAAKAAAEAAKADAVAAAGSASEVANASVTAHNASLNAHPNGIAGPAGKLANARKIFGHSFDGSEDVGGWVYSDVGMIIGKTIKINMTDGKFRVYYEEEDNPLGDVGSGEILTYDPATGELHCQSFTGKATIAADGNAVASQTFVNNKLMRSLATFGYLNCNGVLMQWGLTQMVGQTHGVSFPATYPGDCVSIQATVYGCDESGDLAVVGIESKTASGFVLRAPNATLKPAVMWLATGY